MARGKRKTTTKSSSNPLAIQYLWEFGDGDKVVRIIQEGSEKVLLLDSGEAPPDNYSGKAYEILFPQRWEDQKDIATAEKTIFSFEKGKLHSTNDKPAVIARSHREWRKEGSVHRDGDKPAIIDAAGTKRWFKDGNPHREGDKPAIIHLDGERIWMQYGRFHRDNDKPSVIKASAINGKRRREWFCAGKRHRDGDKPAIIDFDGSRQWIENDKLHRLSGPAVIPSKEKKEEGFLDQYYIYGQRYPTKKEYLIELKRLSDERTLEGQIQKALINKSPTKPRKRISPLAH